MQETLTFLRTQRFAALHVFPYSPRPGTKAAAMSGQLSRAEKETRAARVKALAAEMHRAYLEAQLGKSLPVLFETEEDGFWQGHAENYCLVRVRARAARGVIQNVKILRCDGEALFGTLEQQDSGGQTG
ncbi:MAG: tRNA (N(6)-L-threonylcarbamoyladenosine(37)-C(2))-methylthiotransferase MtaB, partial [Oscillospiraceae bacterium]|nr:tRNA (N(6)-L-threonylcarbamoyladenosine(37)-C(2))-methylthiotransferase MtaB [Oscillospiraceae bacterium]